jgi:serine/threonine-protein phosphatase 2A regulatory subunit B'
MLTLECAGAEKLFSPDHYASLTYFNLLPTLRDSKGEELEELILLKLKLCSVIFPFYKSTSKEVEKCKYIKRQYLLEMVDLLNISAGHSIFTEQVMGAFVKCMAVNIFRVLPPKTEDNNEEGNRSFSEPSWPHLQIAYELLLRFIESPEIHPKSARKFVDRKFLRQILELFDSQDPRERDYLKAILHRTYAKFVCHRVWLRNQISNIFYRFVYETEQHNGIKELLETLGSIINGFAIPLKKEHVDFLIRAVIPLHKPENIYPYHKELSNCMIQYIEKDVETGKVILSGILKFWPWCSSSKQIKFLNELEDILQHLSEEQLAPLREMLFTNIARCLESEHFQIVERCLYLWNNQILLDSENLFHIKSKPCLPIIYGSLNKLASGHWYVSIQEHAQKILIMYKDFDSVGFESVAGNYAEHEADATLKLQLITNKWYAFQEISQSNQFKDLV